MVKKLEMENYFTITEIDMKEISKTINSMEKVLIFIIIMRDMKVIGLMENAMEMEFIISIMEIKLKVNSVNIKQLVLITEI